MENPKFVDVKGVRTRYFESGEGDPLLLVHGGAFGGFDNAEDWEVNFDSLAEHFHTFAIDKVGQGFSDPSFVRRGVRDWRSRQSHLTISCRQWGSKGAHLAGHSRGGYAVTESPWSTPRCQDPDYY